jgi:2-polyprenyl-3-methyl-5-hydroxy-6-metoxy-1,4-benzoquinol methylase
MASRVWDGAEIETRADRVELRTAPIAWTNAAAFPVPITTSGREGFVFVSARTVSGRAGFSLLTADLTTSISKETLLAGDARALIPLAVPEGHDLVHVLVRNASDLDDPSVVQVFGTISRSLPVVELAATDVATALRNPAALHADLVGRAWPELEPAEVPAWERESSVPVRVAVPVPLPLPRLDAVFDDEVGRVVLESVDDLRAAVARFDDEPVADHIATSCRQDMYLRMNTVRVVRLVDALRRRGDGRRLVEVGAWFGSFALPLARLGYEVTAVDRYDSYGRAFETFTDLMRESGVNVVSTTREDEDHALDGLGPFDIAFAGAVIEHVPHTPRALLERLVRAAEPGGLVAVDTPNLVRYWNRLTLARGQSVFQPLDEQFSCDPPWEGHHREFTAPEVVWMLEQVGCRDVEAQWFDYNLLQFEVLPVEHVEALSAFLQDLSQCDMVLAVGRAPASDLGAGRGGQIAS